MATYFFYGTLIDEAVLTAVIRRHPPKSRPAMLSGFRRLYRTGATYPILKPAADGDVVHGRVVDGLTPADTRWLKVFEGPEYLTQPLPVADGAGRVVTASVFLPRSGVPATDIDWSFETWRRRHRSAFLKRVRALGIATH